MREEYQQNGFLLRQDFFGAEELARIEPVLRKFHEDWIVKNREHYESEAINSAYITHKDDVTVQERLALFSFISSDKLLEICRSLIPAEPAFMNTQLFFNPHNTDQKNYWHRDIQYVPESLARQREMLTTSSVLHFRIPFADEPGIELIPGTHARWDDAQEFETRMGKNGRVPSDDLSGGKAVPLKRGDLLVFSANMIHRGLYGSDRFAFDIIFSSADPDLLRYVEADCLPDTTEMRQLKNPQVFANTWCTIKKAS